MKYIYVAQLKYAKIERYFENMVQAIEYGRHLREQGNEILFDEIFQVKLAEVDPKLH